jgi:hypothetical protein
MKQTTARKLQGPFTALIFMLTGAIPSFSQIGNTSYSANTVSIGGSFSVAIGSGVLSSNTGFYNTGMGSQALNKNTSGQYNTAIGGQALFFNTAGNHNTSTGFMTLYNNTGSFNTATGSNVLKSNTTGNENTATGAWTLLNNTTGSGNTANGINALNANTTGTLNTAVGGSSLQSNTIGYANTALGSTTLFSNTTGSFNIANGLSALSSNTTGTANTATGVDALHSNSTGSYNIANGFEALYLNTTGNYNIAIGDSAGHKSTGNRNMFLGIRAGYYENAGSDKMYLANDSNKTLLYGDFSTGQVLMGKGQPSGYAFKGTRTLNVLGGLLTDSIRVALSQNWSDYVFDEAYKLPSLQQVEQYIQVNKHLPGIPSGEEVKQNGIELGEMNAKLLAKIEELTLYVLDQQKQIDKLTKQVNGN